MDDRKQQERISQWIRQQLYVARDEGELYRLAVVHAGQTRSMEIWAENVDKECDPEDLAQTILSQAFDDTESLGGVQTYVINAYFGKRKKPTSKMRFRLRSSEEDWEESSEPANDKGLASQAMRHNEVLMRTAVGATHNVVRMQEKIIDRQAQTIESLQKRLSDMFDLQEELLSEHQQRQIEMLQAERKEKRMDELVDTIKMLGPTIVNRLTGKKLLPEKETPQSLMIAQFIESLEEEQLQKLMGILQPKQIAVVMELVKDHMDKEEEKKKNGTSNQLPSGS